MSGTRNIAGSVMPPEIVPVILAGGEGVRLRPLTSRTRPKPFLRLFSKYSFFQKTALRVRHFASPVVVCHRRHGKRARAELAGIGVTDAKIICEPENRSTTAAIAMAAFVLKDTKQVMAVMPSDHVIESDEVFQKAIGTAAGAAGNGEIIILGVRPYEPSTRYGYIQACDGAGGLKKIEKFVEKPGSETVEALYREQGCYWNTGVFLVKPADFLTFLKAFAPETYLLCHKAFKNRKEGGVYVQPDPAGYEKIETMPVDYAIMENNKEASVLPLETGWHDIGCWRPLLGVVLRSVFAKPDVRKEYGIRRFERKSAQ